MGTRRPPMTPTIAGAARHGVTYLEVECPCGRAKMVPILLAHWRHGGDCWLEKMARIYRCGDPDDPRKPGCGGRATAVTRHWRRPRDFRWWKGRPKLGPCE